MRFVQFLLKIVPDVHHLVPGEGLFHVADVACVMIIHFLIEFVAGENGFLCVNDDDMIAAVCMGSKLYLVLTAKKNGCLSCYAAHGLACCVKHIPFTNYVACFRHIS